MVSDLGKAPGAVNVGSTVASSMEPLAGMGGAKPVPAPNEPSPTYFEWLAIVGGNAQR